VKDLRSKIAQHETFNEFKPVLMGRRKQAPKRDFLFFFSATKKYKIEVLLGKHNTADK